MSTYPVSTTVLRDAWDSPYCTSHPTSLHFISAVMRFLNFLPVGMFALHVTGLHTFGKLSLKFSWTNITATDELQYHNCGGGFECARLQLPLDWNATADSPVYGDKFKMAIVRAPAQVPVTDPRYGGQIILNFGGPGEPGTTHAGPYTKDLQTRFDAAYSYGSEAYVSDHPDARYFDLIFFDPRGISNSTPWYKPFNNTLQAVTFTEQTSALQLEWPPEYNVRCYHYQHQRQRHSANFDAGVTYPPGRKIGVEAKRGTYIPRPPQTT